MPLRESLNRTFPHSHTLLFDYTLNIYKDNIGIFNGFGFLTWQVKVKSHLIKKSLWNVVKPIEKELDIWRTRAQVVQFNTKHKKALGLIITSPDDDYAHYLIDYTTTRKAWQILEGLFGAKSKHIKMSLKM